MPPHNIHTTGVGPYELSASFQTTLALLPNGPRVERFEADGLFDYRLMRTDNDALVLGVGRRNRVAFISVLDPDIARTESGIGVGAGVEELVGTLGAVRTPKGTGRDSRIVTFTALPDTRFIVEGGKVVAAVVMPPRGDDDADADKKGAPIDEGCRVQALQEREPEVLAAAGFGSAPTSILWTCLGSDLGEAVVRSGDSIKIVGSQGPSAPMRVWTETQVPGLDFVAALDTGDERRELYSVSHKHNSKSRQVVVTRYKVAGGRILPVWTRYPFKLKASSASWLGAKVQATDFLVELRGLDRIVQVGGIYVQRDKGILRNVVPVNTIELLDGRSSRKPPSADSLDSLDSPTKESQGSSSNPASP